MIRPSVLACALLALGGGAGAAEPERGAALRFGSVAMNIPVEMHQRLKPLTDYLSAELKQPVELRLSASLSAAASELAAGNVDLAYLTPVAYLRAQREGGARLVVKTVTQGQESFRLMIAVRADSPIRSPRDLAGKSFAFGDKAAILQRAVVVAAGVRLEELGSHAFLGHYDNIARGVANGDFDAGILKDTTAFQWEKQGLRVIYASPPLPPYNIAVSAAVPEPLRLRIRAAFLRLDGTDPRHRPVIKALDAAYDGFAVTDDAEYDVVRKLVMPFEQ